MRRRSRRRRRRSRNLELLFAKAEFAQTFNCVVPRISPDDERHLILREARHPLLEDILRKQQKAVVPIIFALDHEQRTLLISGPNTGGKTVSLKTVGLLALMTHAGLPVPAAEAEFPLFDEVLADIGDHQSIQESLSSFSSHIFRSADAGGRHSGFAGAALTSLAARPIPKKAARWAWRCSTRSECRSVYAGFDPPDGDEGVWSVDQGRPQRVHGLRRATLEPTYVLRLGAPGKSAGLDIASRLGLDPP